MNRHAGLAALFTFLLLGSSYSQAFPEGTYEWRRNSSMAKQIDISDKEIVFDSMSSADRREITKRLQASGLDGPANACVVDPLREHATLTQWKIEDGNVTLPEVRIEFYHDDESYVITRFRTKRSTVYGNQRGERVGSVNTALCETLWSEEAVCKRGEVSEQLARAVARDAGEGSEISQERVLQIQHMMGIASEANPEICQIRARLSPTARRQRLQGINLKQKAGLSEFEYYVGWDECRFGRCRRYHQWIFKFDKDGKLLDKKEVVYRPGDPYPKWFKLGSDKQAR